MDPLTLGVAALLLVLLLEEFTALMLGLMRTGRREDD